MNRDPFEAKEAGSPGINDQIPLGTPINFQELPIYGSSFFVDWRPGPFRAIAFFAFPNVVDLVRRKRRC